MFKELLALIILVSIVSGCAVQPPTETDVKSLRKQTGDGIYQNYDDSLQEGKKAIEKKKLIGLHDRRVYDISKPGIAIREPAKTRTFWIAPRVGSEFVTHGGWITVLIQPEGWVGAPLRGRYLPASDIGASHKSFQRLTNSKDKP